MSIVSQAAVLGLIIVTSAILIYANKALGYAANEGEHFIEEWTCYQKKSKKLSRRNPYSSLRRDEQGEEDVEEIILCDDFQEEKPDSSARRQVRRNVSYHLSLYDERRNLMKRVNIDHFPFSIGRDPSNDLILDDLYVARFHGRIVQKDGQVILQDLGTSNKIYADGYFVSEYELKDQGHFYLGRCELTIGVENYRSHPTTLAARY